LQPGDIPEIGGAMIHCDRGQYEVKKFRWQPRKRVYSSPPRNG
jgi:hypothetical protein